MIYKVSILVMIGNLMLLLIGTLRGLFRRRKPTLKDYLMINVIKKFSK